MCISIISLSKIAHQRWRDHRFNQRNTTTERVVEQGLEATGKGAGVEGLHKIGGLKTPLPAMNDSAFLRP